jgi:protein-disulfide isomerase
MSKKSLLILGGIVVLLLAGAGYYYVSIRHAADAAVAASGVSPASAATLPPDRVQPDDKVMGKADAPVVMVEYFAQACSVCARFDQEVFPKLKAKYIDTGKVRYVMRLLPIFPLDGPSYKLDLCMPPEKFFQAADLLFRNQASWDAAEFPVSDPHGGLLKMAAQLGLSADKADACMNSTEHDAAINKVAQDAVARYQPDGTPTLVIDFKKVDMPEKSWDEVQKALDAALAAKGVH